jgi:hypothetical protein
MNTIQLLAAIKHRDSGIRFARTLVKRAGKEMTVRQLLEFVNAVYADQTMSADVRAVAMQHATAILAERVARAAGF